MSYNTSIIEPFLIAFNEKLVERIRVDPFKHPILYEAIQVMC